MFRKLFAAALLVSTLSQSAAFAADQWAKTEPAGTEAAGTIDNLLRVNNEALDRLVVGYRRGLGVNYATAATLSVLAGECSIPNGAESITRWRRTTAATPIDWSMLDTGVEAVSTQYYLYATADTDITGMLFKISASSTSPSGITYYRKIGQFYNDSSGNITNVVSYREDYGTDRPDAVEGWVNFDGEGTVTVNDQYNVSSITDNGTGDYTVNWATAFASTSYAVVGITEVGVFIGISALTTGSARIVAYDYNGTIVDCDPITVIAVGDMV